MKKLILAAGVMGATLLGVAAANNDPVLMNIAGKDVHLSEFEYLYHKNNSQQVQPQTLDEYVEMFVNYKLKVADAEVHGIDTTAAFMSEFNQFRNELAQPYLVDLAVQDSIVNSIYSQMTDELVVSHIMMHDGSEAKLDSLRSAILDGTAKFEEVAAQYSIDRASSSRGGYMGVVAFGRYPQAFEEMAYSTPVGQISPVVNSGYGIHIIRVDDRHPSEGEVLVEHILRVTRGATDSVAAAEEVRSRRRLRRNRLAPFAGRWFGPQRRQTRLVRSRHYGCGIRFRGLRPPRRRLLASLPHFLRLAHHPQTGCTQGRVPRRDTSGNHQQPRA